MQSGRYPTGRRASHPVPMFILALVTLTAAPIMAARQPPMTLAELFERSGRIIEARVVAHDDRAGDTMRPKTRVTLTRERSIAADAGPPTFVLWLPEGVEAGGDVWGGYVGVPTFVPGETYLLFLHHASWRISPVVNWSFGHLRRAIVGSRELYVDMQGACATEVTPQGITLGPRIVEPPPVPGHGLAHSSIPIRPEMVDDCAPAARIRHELAAYISSSGWRPAPVPVQPSDWSPVTPLAEVMP